MAMTPAHMISAKDGACLAIKATQMEALNVLPIRPYGTSDLSVWSCIPRTKAACSADMSSRALLLSSNMFSLCFK